MIRGGDAVELSSSRKRWLLENLSFRELYLLHSLRGLQEGPVLPSEEQLRRLSERSEAHADLFASGTSSTSVATLPRTSVSPEGRPENGDALARSGDGSRLRVQVTDEEIVAAWDDPDGHVAYEVACRDGLFEMSPATVPETTRAGAVAGRAFACAHMSFAPPSMLFFVKESARHAEYRARYSRADWLTFRASRVLGVANWLTSSIGVRADADCRTAAQAAAHECFHVRRWRWGGNGESEAAARAYGKWAADVLVSAGGTLCSVHVSGEFPHGGTSAGVARSGDVLVAPGSSGALCVWRNFGSTEQPDWRRHHARCPVDV